MELIPPQFEWPKPNLFPRARKIASFIFSHLRYETPSEHFRGGAAQLDRELYDEVPNQMAIDSYMGSSWVIHDGHDGEGRYIEPLQTVRELDRRFTEGVDGIPTAD